MPEPYSLKLLGGVSLAGADGPLGGPVVQHRRLAVLALLAMARNGPVSRDKLIGVLWAESPGESARHSLSDALHILRKTLGRSAILASGDDLRLDPMVVRSDVAAFEAAAEGGAMEHAVELYEGPFLDGFFLSGSVVFDDWAATERKRLARAYEGALERLAESAAAGGDARRAAEWWRRLRSEDPDNSRAVLGLMAALTAIGDRAEALRQAEDHARHLKREYGAAPDPAVTALARRLQEAPDSWVPDAPEPLRESAAATARPPVERRSIPRLAFLGGVAVAVSILLTVSYVSQREKGSDLTPEEVLAANATPGIAVLPFTVNDPDLSMWREGMVDLLSVNLDGLPGLRAIDNRTILARWDEAVTDTVRPDLATALGVARRTGARYALVGSMVAARTDLRLTADVYEARSGTRLGQAQVVGFPDSILGLVDRLTVEVLRTLPREAGLLSQVDLAEVTTASLAALKSYLIGEALYRGGDFHAAASAYERAIASDSMFAFAWDRLFRTCFWGSGSELCPRDPPGWQEEYLARLPARRAEMIEALDVVRQGPVEGIAAFKEMVRKYPDDSDAWYQLGDRYVHFGDWALADRAEGDRALERAVALAPTTSPEPYIHLIEHALADADSARVAPLLDAYERLTLGTATYEPMTFRLAFTLGFGDRAARARARAVLDTVSTETLWWVTHYLGHPRLHAASEEVLQVLLVRPDLPPAASFDFFFRRGMLRSALECANDPESPPSNRALHNYWLYRAGAKFAPEALERILALGAPDTTDQWFRPTDLLVGAYAVDRGRWDEYSRALGRERARMRSLLATGDSLGARRHGGLARALEGYALWKRGREGEAIRALQAAQREINGFERGLGTGGLNVTVRWWLGELMLEAGRLRDAERYFKSLPGDPFAALWLGKVYENLGEVEKARASYEYALLSWQDADPELQPQIQEARLALARRGWPPPAISRAKDRESKAP
jgi:DNA-binding SARP family transcriptional activator/TolB-like protein